MAATHGITGVLKIDISGTQTQIGLQRSMTLNLSMSDADITTKDDNYWMRRLPSLKEWSVDYDAVFDEANAAQDQLWTQFSASPSTTVIVQMAIGGDTYDGNSFQSELSFEAPNDDAVGISGSLLGDGALTKS